MGGSSLAPLVLGEAFGGRLHVLDTTDPDAVLAVPVDGSLFVIASKSGSTLEPEVMEEYFFQATGGDGSRFVAITDPGSKLAARAEERGFRRTFLNRADIGGRFSALSYFGLVPAALAGVAIAPLLDRAAARAGAVRTRAPARPTTCRCKLGALLGDSVAQGRDKLTIIADPGVGPFGLWLEQLIAESTGKEGTGVVPLADEPIGSPEVYGGDRLFAYLRLDGAHDAAVAAFEAAGFHVERCQLADLDDIGAQMITWELATAYCGALLHINPFDQPNVQAAKDYVVAALDGYVETGELESVADGDLPEALRTAERGPLVPRHPGLRHADGRQRGRAAGGPPAAARRARRGHPAGLRPALPALHGPAAQGRLAAGHLPAGAGRVRAPTPRSRAGRTASGR